MTLSQNIFFRPTEIAVTVNKLNQTTYQIKKIVMDCSKNTLIGIGPGFTNSRTMFLNRSNQTQSFTLVLYMSYMNSLKLC